MKPAERRNEAVAGTVLVVDDEADIRELLELTLLRMGLAVESAGNLANAYALLKAKRFELCLTDMRLPDGDGLELVRHIGEHCADLPVAVITAYGSAENAAAAASVRGQARAPAAPGGVAGDAAHARVDRQARAQPGAGIYQRGIRQRQGTRRAIDTRTGRAP